MAEKQIQDLIWRDACKRGFTMFRNNVGLFVPAYTLDQLKIKLVHHEIGEAIQICRQARKIRCGLTPGSGDLIGWRTNPDGVAQFVSIEVKTDTGKLSSDQQNWDEQVRKAGGVSIVARQTGDLDV